MASHTSAALGRRRQRRRLGLPQMCG